MLVKTDIKAVKSMAKTLFDIVPIENNCEYGIVCNPLIDSQYAFNSKTKQILDISKTDDYNIIRNQLFERVDNATLSDMYSIIITVPWQLTFLKYTQPYLSQKDFSKFFKMAWIRSENPNQDVNCSINDLVKMFKSTDKKYLMDSHEYKIFKKLPNNITIYRGVAVNRNPKGLSWTQNLKIATWFANRFNIDNKTGYVQMLNIKSKDVIAYFNTRNEEELIVDCRRKHIVKL